MSLDREKPSDPRRPELNAANANTRSMYLIKPYLISTPYREAGNSQNDLITE